jgi:hypothetical protein
MHHPKHCPVQTPSFFSFPTNPPSTSPSLSKTTPPKLDQEKPSYRTHISVRISTVVVLAAKLVPSHTPSTMLARLRCAVELARLLRHTEALVKIQIAT